jgi:hypothetical protein
MVNRSFLEVGLKGIRCFGERGHRVMKARIQNSEFRSQHEEER